MTYNIRLDFEGDKENNWHHRKEELCQFIQASKSDFVGLQEAIGHQLAYINECLDSYAYIGVGRDDGIAGGEFSPILYDSSTWKIIEANTFWLSETPFKVSRGWDAACHRVVTYGIFRNEGGTEILVANTHFDHVGQVARSESIELINDFLGSFKPELPKVLMGDFNFTPDDENYKALNNSLKDAYVTSIVKKGHLGTFNGFKPDSEANRRIDYMLTDENLEVLDYEVKTPKTSHGYQLSDHFPVTINCKIKK
jgi:endonuclease/exonuclease/phosphatase family metal-dependent hydrolase